MLWKEITIGFLLAGFVGLLGDSFFNALFITNAPGPVAAVENVIVGPIIAILSFVCSVGNVPLAAVLWSGGISFGGVLAFIFADLLVLPIIAIYRKYYGWTFTMRISLVMFATMAVAALAVDGAFTLLGIVPSARPTRADIFSSIQVDYKLFLNILGLIIFAALFAVTMRRGVTDPVCGMKVDRAKAITLEHAGHTWYFCSEHCRNRFQADPDRYTHGTRSARDSHAAHAH
jgi:YHS domain-containing protein